MSILRRGLRRLSVWLIVVATLAPLTGCADQSEASVDEGLTLRVVLPDGNIREPGTICSGARAFRFAHPDAPYVIQDAVGTEVASGALPDGIAEKALDIDMGDVKREPTVCVMTLAISGVEALAGHALVIGDRAPVPIEINSSQKDLAEVVLR